MRKVLVWVLIAALGLSLFGCKASDSEQSEGGETEASESSDASESTESTQSGESSNSSEGSENSENSESSESSERSEPEESSDPQETEEFSIDEIVSGMSLDEKISQMIIIGARSWTDDESGGRVTDLAAMPGLKEALLRHAYGGFIVFGSNITGAGQLTKLCYDLQMNQIYGREKQGIPYFLSADQEGGSVIRLNMGTRMSGNMALGATGQRAAENALITGSIIGRELAAAGLNVDFAPVADVNNHPDNPVIGIRSFSDDPSLVATLACAYNEGLRSQGIIGTFKHFPGHGDTGLDSHVDLPTVEKTLEELNSLELIPFRRAIASGAKMIMTAHITFPLIDEEVTFASGEKGFFPATMSERIITGILRGELGFQGVVVTDALEMGAIEESRLVPGAPESVEYRANIASHVINAGVDMLLLPLDLTSPEAADFYDEYIAALIEKVKTGEIDEGRIDESVRRILELKKEAGILEKSFDRIQLEEALSEAERVIGSKEHHEAEHEIALQAVTLLENKEQVLPLGKDVERVVLLGRNPSDTVCLERCRNELVQKGLLREDASVLIDAYLDADGNLDYSQELDEAIREADAVLILSKCFGLRSLRESADSFAGIQKAIEASREGGAAVVLISTSLPYDAARFQEADAILLCYMGTGLDIDPTDAVEGESAYNANVAAAVAVAFGERAPTGVLPVKLPALEEGEDGLVYSREILYSRGFGLTYEEEGAR